MQYLTKVALNFKEALFLSVNLDNNNRKIKNVQRNEHTAVAQASPELSLCVVLCTKKLHFVRRKW